MRIYGSPNEELRGGLRDFGGRRCAGASDNCCIKSWQDSNNRSLGQFVDSSFTRPTRVQRWTAQLPGYRTIRCRFPKLRPLCLHPHHNYDTYWNRASGTQTTACP